MLTPEQIAKYRETYLIKPIGEEPKQGTFDEVRSRVSEAGSKISDIYAGQGEYADQSIARKATGMVGAGFSTILGTAKDLLPQGAENVLDKTGEGISKGMNWVGGKLADTSLFKDPNIGTPNYPDPYAKIEDKLGTVANLGGIAGDILAVGGGAKTLQTGVDKTLQAVKPVANATGRVLKSAGESSYGTTVIPEESTRGLMQSYQASQGSLFNRVKNLIKGDNQGAPITEANTAARKGLMGTEWKLGVQAKQVAGELWDKTIKPALESSKAKVNMKSFFTELERDIRKTADLARRADLLEGLSALKESYKKVGNINLPKLQAYKEGWAEFVPEATYKGKPIASSLKAVKDLAAEKARGIIYKNGGEGIQQAYIDYGNLKSIMKAGIKSVSDPAKKGISSNVWHFLMDKAVTPVATVSGNILYKTGEGLEFIGKSGAKKVQDIIGADITPAAVLKAEQSFKSSASEYIKNPPVGLSIKDVGKSTQIAETFQRLKLQRKKLLEQGLSENSPAVKNIDKTLADLTK